MTPAPSGIGFGTILSPTTLAPILAERGNTHDRQITIGDAVQVFHVWIHGRESLRRPAVSLPLDETFALRLAVASQFYNYLRGRRPSILPRRLRLTRLQHARLILLLHAYDFYQAGGGPRDIARSLIDVEAAALPAIEWKSSAARRKANRLIRDATDLVRGGYLTLLRGG